MKNTLLCFVTVRLIYMSGVRPSERLQAFARDSVLMPIF